MIASVQNTIKNIPHSKESNLLERDHRGGAGNPQKPWGKALRVGKEGGEQHCAALFNCDSCHLVAFLSAVREAAVLDISRQNQSPSFL